MKLRKITSLVLVLMMTLTLGVQASSNVEIMPIKATLNNELATRVEYVSYQEGLLTAILSDETLEIKVDDQAQVEEVAFLEGTTLGEQLTDLPEHTLLDVTLFQGELSYSLSSIEAAHIPMHTISAPVVTSENMSDDYFTDLSVVFEDQAIELEVGSQVIDGKVMLPLRHIAEALGYEVTWNNETKRVELAKGVHFTAVTIGENGYFVNRMAPSPLSSAPVIVEGRTMVPAEFFAEILGYGFSIEEGVLTLVEETFVSLTGYIYNIERTDNYTRIAVAPTEDAQLWDTTVLIVNDDTIINTQALEEGDMIHSVHMPIMTMSLPPTTGAVILY